jgi:hypothetical protein
MAKTEYGTALILARKPTIWISDTQQGKSCKNSHIIMAAAQQEQIEKTCGI